jgi:MFS family permease
MRIRDFRLLFLGRTISTVGNAFTSVALAFGILDATGSVRDVGFVLASQLAATVLMLLFGGAWSDRSSRRLVLTASSVVSAGAQASVAALLLTDSATLPALAVLAALVGAASAFAQPAQSGALPQVVPADLLQSANALFSVVRNSASIGGAALAGVLVAATSPGWALAADAASFVGYAGLVWRMSPLPPTGQRSSILAELREGWSEFTARTWVWAIVLQFSVVNVAYVATLDVYAPIVARDDLGGAAAYGAITAALGVGGVAGGLTMARWRPRLPLLVATFGIGVGIAVFVGLAARAPLAMLVPLAAVTGVGLEVFSVLWASSLQEHIPAARLSRVVAYDSLGSYAVVPVGYALAGPAITALGSVHAALWAACALLAVPTIAVLAVHDVRHLRT